MTKPMTADELAAIEARYKAAAGGEWKRIFATDSVEYACVASGSQYIIRDIRIENADFVAHARQDLPACLKEIERLQQQTSRNCEGCGKPIDMNYCADCREKWAS